MTGIDERMRMLTWQLNGEHLKKKKETYGKKVKKLGVCSTTGSKNFSVRSVKNGMN